MVFFGLVLSFFIVVFSFVLELASCSCVSCVSFVMLLFVCVLCSCDLSFKVVLVIQVCSFWVFWL
jgi:hypothetical protein